MTRLASRVGTLVVLLLLATGCDLAGVGGETVLLRDLEAVFAFSFQGSSISPGTPREYTSTESVEVDLAGYVRDQGFTPGDVEGVTPESARLFVNFPPGQELGFLDRVTVRLSGPDREAVPVASIDQLPANRRQVSVPVESERNIQAYLSAPVTALLEVTTSESLSSDETYELEVELTLAVEVGGL